MHANQPEVVSYAIFKERQVLIGQFNSMNPNFNFSTSPWTCCSRRFLLLVSTASKLDTHPQERGPTKRRQDKGFQQRPAVRHLALRYVARTGSRDSSPGPAYSRLVAAWNSVCSVRSGGRRRKKGWAAIWGTSFRFSTRLAQMRCLSASA